MMEKRIGQLAVELYSYCLASVKMKNFATTVVFENFSMHSEILFPLLLETIQITRINIIT